MDDNQSIIHGTLVRIDGEGILLRGKPGVGKSTAALQMLAGGGQLVADDVVLIKRVGNELHGAAPPLLKGILAIPALGIFDIREVLGSKYFTTSSVIKRFVDIGWRDVRGLPPYGTEIHGIKLRRMQRKSLTSGKSTEFIRNINLLSVKCSEAKFLQFHNKLVASPEFPIILCHRR